MDRTSRRWFYEIVHRLARMWLKNYRISFTPFPPLSLPCFPFLSFLSLQPLSVLFCCLPWGSGVLSIFEYRRVHTSFSRFLTRNVTLWWTRLCAGNSSIIIINWKLQAYCQIKCIFNVTNTCTSSSMILSTT